MKRNKNLAGEGRRKGFSLIELIVTIAIMAVLTAVLTPALLTYVERSRAQKDDSAMGEVTNAVKLVIADEVAYDEAYGARNGEGKAILHFKNNGCSYFVDEANLDSINDSSPIPDDSTFYKTLVAIVGNEIKLTSRTHRNDDYIIEVDFSDASNEMGIKVSGEWSSTDSGNGESTPASIGDSNANYWFMAGSTKVYLDSTALDIIDSFAYTTYDFDTVPGLTIESVASGDNGLCLNGKKIVNGSEWVNYPENEASYDVTDYPNYFFVDGNKIVKRISGSLLFAKYEATLYNGSDSAIQNTIADNYDSKVTFYTYDGKYVFKSGKLLGVMIDVGGGNDLDIGHACQEHTSFVTGDTFSASDWSGLVAK